MNSFKDFFTKKQWGAVGIGALVLIVASAGAGYKVGATASRSLRSNGGNFGGQMMRDGQGGQNRAGGAGMMRGGNGNVSGTILEQNDGSLTISIPQGGSRTVLLAPTTTVLKTTPGTATDLTLKQNVMISGTSNADGSITANTISIRPEGMTMPGMQDRRTQ